MFIVQRKSDKKYFRGSGRYWNNSEYEWVENIEKARVYKRSCDAVQSIGIPFIKQGENWIEYDWQKHSRWDAQTRIPDDLRLVEVRLEIVGIKKTEPEKTLIEELL